jgi:hypothetical protein
MKKWKDKYSSDIKDTCSFYWPVDLDNYNEKSKSKNVDIDLDLDLDLYLCQDQDKEQSKLESYFANKIIKSWKSLCTKIQSNKYKYMKENLDINDYKEDYSIRYSSRYLIEYKNIYKDKYLINLKKEHNNSNEFILNDIIHKKIIKNIQIENITKQQYSNSNSHNNNSNFYYDNSNTNLNTKSKKILDNITVISNSQNNYNYLTNTHIDTKYLNQIESILDNVCINLYIY